MAFLPRFVVAQTFFFFMYLSMVAVCVPVAYRYFAICRNRVLSRAEMTLGIAFVALMAASVPVSCSMFIPLAEEVLPAVESGVGMSCHDASEVPMFGLDKLVSGME